MALSATTQWWVRNTPSSGSGDELNGGGFDPEIASAGTNRSDSDTAHVTFNGTTVTATTAGVGAAITITGYTVAAADIGNILRIASGTNFIAGYYVITAVNTGLNTWTLDRNCTSGAGAAMVGRMGGAHASLVNYSNGGSGLATPIIATPLLPGNIINIRESSGSGDPSVSNYDYSAGYWTFPSGDTTNGAIKLIGYNGRPRISYCGLLIYATYRWMVKHVSFIQTAATFTTYGVAGDAVVSIIDCIVDQNGHAARMLSGGNAAGAGQPEADSCVIFGNEVRNTGGGAFSAAGQGIVPLNYAVLVYGNYVHHLRGNGITCQGHMATVAFNIVTNNLGEGIAKFVSASFVDHVFNNTVAFNEGKGIEVDDAGSLHRFTCFNNLIVGNGDEGMGFGETLSLNKRMVNKIVDYNNVFGNSAAYENWEAQEHDQAIDPEFVDEDAGDFAIEGDI